MTADQAGAGEPRAESEAPVFVTLLALQDEDVLAGQLRHRRGHLPERGRAAALEKELGDLLAESGRVGERRDGLARRRDELDAEAGQLGARVRRIEELLASGGAASFRDQEAMAAEVASLAKHREALEDEELAVMEEIEPLEKVLAELDGRRSKVEDGLGSARRELAEAEAAVGVELEEVAGRRAPLAAALPPGLLLEYSRLAERLGGVAVARLVRGTCAGCHLSLSATELDRIRHALPGTVAHCEQCGRILVPTGQP